MTLRRLSRLALLHAAALPVVLGVVSPALAETLTAEAALATAARDNPSLRAALLDARAARLGVEAERGARDAVLDATVSAGYDEAFRGGRRLTRQAAFVITSVASVSYTTDSGTALEAGTQWRRDAVGPQYDGLVYGQVTQPLLRGAGSDAQLSGLRSAEASSTAEELRRSATASQTALDVLRGYYELWYAERAVEVEQEALKTAQRQVEEAKLRESALGTGSRLDVLQFATSAASFADALSQARATRSARAIELGRLLGVTPERARALEASGELPVLAPPPSSRMLLDGVSARSPELAAARADLASMSIRLDAAKDADQPQLDLFSRASAGGTWRDDELPGLELPGSQPAWSVEVGLHLELPLGGGRAAAEASRASVELAAAQQRYKAEAERIRAEVTTLSENLAAANEQVALATETSKRATELVEAERQRLQLGTTTPSDVVKAEQTAREAELRRLRAVVSKLTSQYELEHASGALLERFPVSPAEKS